MRALSSLAPLAAAALGLAVGAACGDTLVDHRNTAVRDAGNGGATCLDGQLVCGTTCPDLDPAAQCEACATPCGPPPLHSTVKCTQAGAHAGACGHDCDPGYLDTGTACVPASAVAAGDAFSCAIAAGAVHCWGANAQGQLGDGTTTLRKISGKVIGLAGVTALGAGAAHACAASGATVSCWGLRAGWGGGAGSATSPVAVECGNGAQVVEQLAAGAAHTCVRLASGTVRCKGEANASGGGAPALGGTALEIAAGDGFTCALVDASAARRVECWGANDHAQLGTGSAGSAQATPVAVPLGGALLHVAAGARHACVATDADPGPTTCWGDNAGGQVSRDGALTDVAPTQNTRVNKALYTAGAASPLAAGGAVTCVVVVDATNALTCFGSDALSAGGVAGGEKNQITFADPPAGAAVGAEHACFVAPDGRLRCWGHGALGQLGDGAGSDAAVPVLVIER
jgi:alpha-tubulin suppressor-like RCC1 family protein